MIWFSNFNKRLFLGYSDPTHVVFHNKNNNYWDDLTDVSTETTSLLPHLEGVRNKNLASIGSSG